MKQKIKNILALVLFLAIVVAAVWLLPLKGDLVIIILLQVVMILAWSGTVTRNTTPTKPTVSHEQEEETEETAQHGEEEA